VTEPGSTHTSLLRRATDTSDEEAWRQFDARYGELVLRYCRAQGLQYADAEDVRQRVMLNLVRYLPHFAYSRSRGRFRAYLRQIVCHEIGRQRSRRHDASGPPAEGFWVREGGVRDTTVDEVWEREWMQHHIRRAMRAIRRTHDARSLRVFDELLAGRSVRDVAMGLGMSVQAVQKVRQRIRRHLRELVAIQIREEEHGVGAGPA